MTRRADGCFNAEEGRRAPLPTFFEPGESLLLRLAVAAPRRGLLRARLLGSTLCWAAYGHGGHLLVNSESRADDSVRLPACASGPKTLASALPQTREPESELAHGDVACVLAEPALTNIGIVLPERGYHEALSEVTRRHGTLLIIDETHTICAGPGGYTRAYGLEPDMLTIGKPIASGIPAAAYGFSDEVADGIKAAMPRGARGCGRRWRDARGQRPLARGDARDALGVHLYALNRGILLTPFHNIALMSPATTEAEVDLHTSVFEEPAQDLTTAR